MFSAFLCALLVILLFKMVSRWSPVLCSLEQEDCTVPDRENSCAVKDWMYTLLKPDYKVFTTLRYVSELDFLENVSLLSDDFQAAILQIPDRYEFTSIGELEKLDDVIFEEDEFSYTSKIKEKNTDITLEYRDKKFTVTIPFCDNIHAEDAVHCLCYLVKSGLYKESHKKVFETLSLPDDQIKMRDAEFNMGLISCFSSVNNLYSISKTFDFLARQHQFEGRCAVIKNPDFENLSAEEFFEGLFFLAKSAEIRKIVFIGYFSQIPYNEDIRITKYDTVQDYINNFSPRVTSANCRGVLITILSDSLEEIFPDI